MQLTDLPQFTIRSVSLLGCSLGFGWEFDHLETVREGRSWLYVSRPDSLIGDLEALDKNSRRARFNTFDRSEPPNWVRGATLPWLDGYWQAFHVTLILDPDHLWERVTFAARDALQSYAPGLDGLSVRMWRDATGEEARAGETLIPAAWDHEHCMLCNKHIDPGDNAYHDAECNWLCVACYTSYAEPHDLSFVRT